MLSTKKLNICVEQISVSKANLCVDGLNLSRAFGFVKTAWNLEYAKKNIKEFVTAARNSGWELYVFIDAGIETPETMDKWKKRREIEVISCAKDIPHGMSALMGDIFKMNNVTVFYSPWDADNDDCLATYAQKIDASILSNDNDFCRYKNKKYIQYEKYKIVDEKLILTKKKFSCKQDKHFLDSLPKMETKYPGFVSVKYTNSYIRGSPSFSTKIIGNFHGYVKNLRYLLYKKWDLKKVTETWPEYSMLNNQVIWLETEYTDDMIIENIRNYYEYYSKIYNCVKQILVNNANIYNSQLFDESENWNIQISLMLCVSEIAAVLEDTSVLFEFEKLFENEKVNNHLVYVSQEFYEKNYPTPCYDWKKEGNCKRRKCFNVEGHFICKCWRGSECRFRHE